VHPAASRGRDLDSESPANPNLAWITFWLDQAELANEQIYQLTCNFQFGLFVRMENDVVLPTDDEESERGIVGKNPACLEEDAG
jgi:hypothetical protein